MAAVKKIVESITDERIKHAQKIVGKTDISENDKAEVIYLLMVLKNMNNSKRSTGKVDMSGQEVLENDIITNPDGLYLKICYGTYEAYCPADRCYMENVGFYAIGKGLPDMPIGALEDYAIVVGNVIDNPDLEAML